MSNQDTRNTNLSFNEVTQKLEEAIGTSWVPVTLTNSGTAPAPNVVSFVDIVGFSSLLASYEPTLTTVTITPSSITSVIKISVTGGIGTASPTASGVRATIYKDGVNVVPDSLATYFDNSGTLNAFMEVPASLQWIETPGDTNPHTYTVRIKNDDNLTEVRWGNASSDASGIIVAEEIH